MQKISSRINRSVLASTFGPLICVGLLAASGAASGADFSGVWLATTPRGGTGASQPELTPRARADLDAFDPLSDPVIRCVPPGFPRSGLIIYPFEIVQTEELVVFLYEVFGMVRRIRIDGGPPPDYLPPARTGYSVGHWEQDELVIDTNHVESGLLSGGGVAQYGDVSILERYSLGDDGQTLAAEVTITAPETFVAPWTRHSSWELDPDDMIFDAPCDPADSRF